MLSILLSLYLEPKMEQISLWWVGIASLSLIIFDFDLKIAIESCFRLIELSNPSNRQILIFKLDFDSKFKYISAYAQFILLFFFGYPNASLIMLYVELIKNNFHLFKKVYKKRKSLKNVEKNLGREGFNQFFEYKSPMWYWYHYLFLIGSLLSWISSLVLGLQNNQILCPLSVFLTFGFLNAFHVL